MGLIRLLSHLIGEHGGQKSPHLDYISNLLLLQQFQKAGFSSLPSSGRSICMQMSSFPLLSLLYLGILLTVIFLLAETNEPLHVCFHIILSAFFSKNVRSGTF